MGIKKFEFVAKTEYSFLSPDQTVTKGLERIHWTLDTQALTQLDADSSLSSSFLVFIHSLEELI